MKQNNYLKNIKNAIHEMDTELLRDTLAYVLKVYVVDKQSSPPASVPGNQPGNPAVEETPQSFAGIIRDLKKRCTFAELNLFSVEGNKVFIHINNTRYELTDTGTASPGTGPESNTYTPPGKETIKENGSSPSGRFEKLELD
jgi:hypothetical protein